MGFSTAQGSSAHTQCVLKKLLSNRLGGQLYILLMFTNCRSFNEGAVVSGNTDETSIILLFRRITHYM